MYNPEIATESLTLGIALLTGMVLGVYYDIFRIIRRIIHCGYANILTQDLFFWATAAIFIFFTAIKVNNGKVRIIFIAAVLIGWVIYLATVGALVMFLAEKIIGFIANICRRLHKKVVLAVQRVTKIRINSREIKKVVEIDNNFSNTA